MVRDRRIDTIRGLMIAIMLVDHTGGFLKTLTYQPLGYVSAAEGFVFLSGFVCSKVYGRHTSSWRRLVSKTLQRALLVYRYHLMLGLFLCLLNIAVPQYRGYCRNLLDPSMAQPLKSFFLYLLLLHQPGFLCILPMYCMLLILCPGFLLLIRSGRTRLALTASFLLWVAGQYVDPVKHVAALFGPYCENDIFNIFSFQLLFVIGLCLGHCDAFLKKVCDNRRLFWSLVLMCLVCDLLRHLPLPINSELIGQRVSLPVHRLVNFCLLLVPLWYFGRQFPRDSFLPYFEYLGRNSLKVFSLHVAVHYLLLPAEWRFDLYCGSLGTAAYCVATFAAITFFIVFSKRYQPPLFLEGTRAVQRQQ